MNKCLVAISHIKAIEMHSVSIQVVLLISKQVYHQSNDANSFHFATHCRRINTVQLELRFERAFFARARGPCFHVCSMCSFLKEYTLFAWVLNAMSTNSLKS